MKKVATTLLLICVTAFAQQKGTFTDTRDGKTYKTVKIGEQVWMAENLNYNAKDSKCYDNDENNCKKYGRLYDISTAMKACPSGWSLPSYGVRGIEGYDETLVKKLKSASGWSNNGNGTDEYGFSALPGGLYYDGRFHYVGKEGNWWGAYDSNKDTYYYSMDNNDHDSWNSSKGMPALFSVRCVQNLTAAEAAAREAKEAARLAALQSSFTDTRDGKTYKTVKIGKQTWMAENLNYNAKGSKCYGEGGKVQGACLRYNKRNYCEEYATVTLSNSEVQANCTKYGRLYDWNTAMKACPSGWHLPNYDDEWEILRDFAGGSEAGKYLKTKSGWNDSEGVSGNGTDNYGFSALPGGYGELDSRFYDIGNHGDWWSAIEDEEHFNSAYHQYYSSEGEGWFSTNKSFLLSVRCLKN